ncbi:MAG: sigma-70 family RNA polymerase sigma factor [Actinomycetota bacterium]
MTRARPHDDSSGGRAPARDAPGQTVIDPADDPADHRDDSIASAEALYSAHIELALRLARRYSYSGQLDDDMAQVARIALWLAAERYESDRGVFVRFAAVTIVGELKKHLRSNGWAVHVPRGLQEDALTVGRTIDRLSGELGRAPTPREVAHATGFAVERVVDALEVRTARYSSDDSELEHRPAREESMVDSIELRRALTAMSDDDQRLIAMRFVDGLTQSEIAARVGVSQTQVHRRLVRAISELRQYFDPEIA